MRNHGKKVISLLVCLTLVFSILLPANAAINDRVRVRLEGIGLMEGHADGSFGEDEELTRAQMAMIAARMLHLEGIDTGANSFTDVPDDHWASGVINTMSQYEVIEGVGNGMFLPDKSVSYAEAVKIIVSTLGYAGYAEDLGGYPDGYLIQAARMGILQNVSDESGKFTRGAVAQLLDNALDIIPMGTAFMENYNGSRLTLYEILTDNKDLLEIRGILTETHSSSLLTEKPGVKQGYVRINDVKLICDLDMDEYLGKEIIAYVYEDDKKSFYTLKNFAVTNENEFVEAMAEDVVFSGDTATISDAEGKEIELDLEGVGSLKTIYNGRLANISPSGRAVTYGSYAFLDNDGDGRVEVLFINEAQSFLVEKVNLNTSMVYFRNRATLFGRNAVVLDAEDEEKVIRLTDLEGNAISLEDVQKGSGITVFSSLSSAYVKAVISTESVSAKVTGISQDGISLDGSLYKLALKPDGTAHLDLQVGEQGNFILDMYGNIIDTGEAITSSYQYAYAIQASHGTGLSGSLKIQTISGFKPNKEVKKVGDDEHISYHFQNNQITVYECASKVKLNGTRVDADTINLALLTGSMIAFNVNGDGQINELYTETAQNIIYEEYNFNAELISFGGETVSRGYLTDETTAFICIPNHVRTNEDYYQQVTIDDESAGNRVYGTVFFADMRYETVEAQPVDVLLIKTEMDSSAPAPIQTTDDICIVGEISRVISDASDDAGASVFQMQLLNGDVVEEFVVRAGSIAEPIAARLHKGDLIRYAKDGYGRIINIQKLISVQDLGNDYSKRMTVGSGVEYAIYGLAYELIPDTFDHFSNQMVDKLQLDYSGNGSSPHIVYRLFRKDPPPVYKYMRKSGWITQGKAEDILTYNQVGEYAESVLAIVESNDIKAIVVINDKE